MHYQSKLPRDFLYSLDSKDKKKKEKNILITFALWETEDTIHNHRSELKLCMQEHFCNLST